MYVEVGPPHSQSFWSSNGFKEKLNTEVTDNINFIIDANCFRFNDTIQFLTLQFTGQCLISS